MMHWRRFGIQSVARVQSALPIVGVALLAGYTWWLVQSAPGSSSGGSPQVPESVPDYVMEQATVERFDAAGQTISVLEGRNISHYLHRDRLVVQGLHLSALDVQGQKLQAVASEGRYTGDSAVIDLTGHAQVTVVPTPQKHAEGPVVFDGDALSVDTRTRQLRSDKPARLSSAQGVIHGSSLSHDARTGISQVGGRVTGRLLSQAQPPSSR